jgi:hypothetical protein
MRLVRKLLATLPTVKVFLLMIKQTYCSCGEFLYIRSESPLADLHSCRRKTGSLGEVVGGWWARRAGRSRSAGVVGWPGRGCKDAHDVDRGSAVSCRIQQDFGSARGVGQQGRVRVGPGRGHGAVA